MRDRKNKLWYRHDRIKHSKNVTRRRVRVEDDRYTDHPRPSEVGIYN